MTAWHHAELMLAPPMRWSSLLKIPISPAAAPFVVKTVDGLVQSLSTQKQRVRLSLALGSGNSGRPTTLQLQLIKLAC